ncbi:MAG TPA: hypothetical protein GX521_09580 [Firmicutes bacterium]|nr:hypothetical protein [Bacillota bacterium]
MDKRLLPLLPYVEKPARYTNGELHACRKDWANTACRVALAFPDIYDVGMGNLGYKILYDIINARPDALAERAYAPWLDLQQKMEERADSRAVRGIPRSSIFCCKSSQGA